MATFTTAQKAALLADIQGDGAALALYTGPTQDLQALADMYNTEASPVFVVWKSFVSTEEMKDVMDWPECAANMTDKQIQMQRMLVDGGGIKPTNANVRTAMGEVFTQANTPTTRAALIALAKRNATRAEKVLATGTGTTNDPGTPSFTGSLAYTDFLELE